MSRRALPGVAVAVTYGGYVLSVAGYGRDSSNRPVTGSTPFYLGSTSKAFTGVALMQLVEAGQIELDAPVQRYLPEFKLADQRAGSITVRHLLNHTSGMWEVGIRQWSLPQPDSLATAVARLRRARLATEPGTTHNYFNPNYATAARLVEVISGRPFDDYMRTQVFLPLGMTETRTVDFVDERRHGIARGHVYAFGHAFIAPGGPFFINGAGGIATTATDMSKWLIAQANGGRAANGSQLLSSQALRETHTPSAASRGYAFGWNVANNGRISHSGGLPTYSSYVAFFENGDGVVVLCPCGDSNAPRDMALGILSLRKGLSPPANSAPLLPRIDLVAGLLLAGNWAFTAWKLTRTRKWATTPRPWWRIAVGFVCYAATAIAVLIALPMLLGRVVPWSWLWLAYYYPVETGLLLSLALTSVLILVVRIGSLMKAGTRAAPAQ
ncbi:CubicO group peptidase (beta-lactamase class C family) [Povalibacter uvarum]|uniref:CubicO group peptidase (Beta-lactamase class C family) n=2 Tax=Povalibacter uvarum TaxID=732238 RepID=A0A841HWD4_9GAMM|nr:CubicO group peptidase (beta-lactamase class C family) [Povalibacter uvarum]